MSERPPELSIIIPAYNEEKRLPRTLARIRDYFKDARARGREIEILVVDDGSTDGTARVAQEWMREMPCLRLISNNMNRGKGYSVRHGMLEIPAGMFRRSPDHRGFARRSEGSRCRRLA